MKVKRSLRIIKTPVNRIRTSGPFGIIVSYGSCEKISSSCEVGGTIFEDGAGNSYGRCNYLGSGSGQGHSLGEGQFDFTGNSIF